MDWTKRDGVWVSGPYTIELLMPGTWALSRRTVPSDVAPLEVENWWTGRSLREMKLKAESLEVDRSRIRSRNRQLLVAFFALMVLVAVAGSSGPLAGALAITAACTVMYGLARVIDHTLHDRPWDNVPETYQ